jgi:uncharacterized protein (TIGR02265 family)
VPTFTAQGSMFEGLYVKVLKPTGPFRDDLAKAGFDMGALKPEYPMDVWIACLEVTARHLHPTLERHDAFRLIGRDFVTGFLDTIVGRLAAVALPFLSPKSFIDRSPRFMRMGVKEVQPIVEWVGPQSAVMTFDGPDAGTAFIVAGVLDVCLGRLGVSPTLVPRSLVGTASRLAVSW